MKDKQLTFNYFKLVNFNNLVICLLILIYAPLIFHWCDGWLNKNISTEHEYFSHGLIGFPLAVYICWLKRKKWERLEEKSHPLAVAFMLIGSWFYLSGVVDFVNLSFPLVLTGICLWLKGISGVKLFGFPLTLVWLATPNPLPYLITPFTLPLQAFIAATVAFILMNLGIDVYVEQIYIAIGGRLVEVAPYCAGLKMLFTSLYVCLMLLYWTDNLSDRRKTSFLLTSTIVISIAANIIRNTLLAYFHGTGKDQAFAWLHDSWGGDLYSVIMLSFIVAFLKIIDKQANE
jgi:cyanoexosortase B